METAILIVRDADGAIVDVAACNEKSRNKSLEQGELWVVTPETGRVLPFRDGGVRYERFIEGDRWFEVRLVGGTDGEGTAAHGASSLSREHGVPGARVAPPKREAAEVAGDSVLVHLGDLIAERRRTMPEGSYTTHLFSKGRDKIRKKVGEEAIEVILAATAEELRSEAADLIYHLMVLLEVEGMRLDQVVEELAARHRTG